MTNPRVRYAVAYFEKDGSWLVGFGTNKLRETGWYRLIYDEDGREAVEAGPCSSAEEALRAGVEPTDVHPAVNP